MSLVQNDELKIQEEHLRRSWWNQAADMFAEVCCRSLWWAFFKRSKTWAHIPWENKHRIWQYLL